MVKKSSSNSNWLPPKKTLEPKFLDTRSRTHHYTNAIDADYLIYSY